MSRNSKMICDVEDVKERSEMMKGEEWSCSNCCATSDDSSTLCKPVRASDNLFCKDFSGN